MLERIEQIMNDEAKELDDEEEKDQKGEDPRTRFLGSTKTSWINFQSIATAIRREPQHILDFLKAELDVEGNFGAEGNMIIHGKWQNKHITNL